MKQRRVYEVIRPENYAEWIAENMPANITQLGIGRVKTHDQGNIFFDIWRQFHQKVKEAE